MWRDCPDEIQWLKVQVLLCNHSRPSCGCAILSFSTEGVDYAGSISAASWQWLQGSTSGLFLCKTSRPGHLMLSDHLSNSPRSFKVMSISTFLVDEHHHHWLADVLRSQAWTVESAFSLLWLEAWSKNAWNPINTCSWIELTRWRILTHSPRVSGTSGARGTSAFCVWGFCQSGFLSLCRGAQAPALQLICRPLTFANAEEWCL